VREALLGADRDQRHRLLLDGMPVTLHLKNRA
jgi:hypothetical protein